MSTKELSELARLQRKWACMKASKREIMRCMELESKQRARQS